MTQELEKPIVQPSSVSNARPVLTLPAQEAELLREQYTKSQVILEYGSGGSTALAADLPGKTVFSVESDAKWAKMMESWVTSCGTSSHVHIHHVDLGPTKAWGYPVDDRHWRRFIHYPFSVWSRKDFIHPDTVLIDGRFRVGCFFATLFQASRPVTILFDDYVNRPYYHIVEEFADINGREGRLAKFCISPQDVSKSDLFKVISKFNDVR